MSATTNGQSVTDTLISPFAGQIAYHERDERQPALESPFASPFAESPDLEGEEVTESPYHEDSADTLDEVTYDPQPEADSEIIEPDERQLVNNTLAVPYRWICSLDVMSANGNTLNRGTGLLIGPRHVLTAAHNIYRPDGTGPSSVYAAPARNGRSCPLGRVKAVAYTTTSAFFKTSRPGRFDFALITLEKDISAQKHRAFGDQALGYWGHPTLGHGTVLRALKPDFLAGKPVWVCGYPGDWCGRTRLDPIIGCSKQDQATAQLRHHGLASFRPGLDGVMLHTADTHEGQSGSPVWMEFNDGSRYLVGVHVDAHRVFAATDDASPVRELPITANMAVHLSDDVLRLVRSWMSPATAVQGGSKLLNPLMREAQSTSNDFEEPASEGLDSEMHWDLAEANEPQFEDEEPEFEWEVAEPIDSGPWAGSADQIAFREKVLAAHLAHSRRKRGSPLRDLSADEAKRLVTVPGTKIKTFPDTAAAAARLLNAANAELAKDKAGRDADALRTIGLGVSSGYRGSQTQRDLWLGYFKDYYNQTRAAREKIPAGPHSTQAVSYMLDPGGFGLRGKIAAPGYSNHQNGIAIDFLQTRAKGHAIKNSTKKEWRKAWYASWFHRWLRNNAHLFDFQPIPTEEWHWEYRKGAVSRAVGGGSVEAFDTLMDDSEEGSAVSSPESEFGYEAEPTEPWSEDEEAWDEVDYEDESSPSWMFDEEDGTAQDFASSGLEWPGRSAEELKFMRAVYDRQVTNSTGTYTADLPNVATIEGKHKARPDAAKAARALLAQARTDLAAAGLAGSVRVGIVSAYRPASEQFIIWQGKGRSGGFPYYYRQMLDQGRLRRGDFGPTAVAKMATEMSKWIAAPGFSNHQDGLAIDFGTGDRQRGGLGKIGTRSWFHKWLTTNARRFGFHPYESETWHWTYRGPVSSEAWPGEVTPGAISAGEIKVQDVPLLSAHRGTRPSYDLILGWNAMSATPEAIDVVVHLHGYWYPRPQLLDDIRPVSGLDLAPKQSAERRVRPTLTVLPRGHDTGITQKWKRKDGTYKYGYNRFTFPRLVTKHGLTSLIRFALDRFAKQVGGPTPRVGRLILTAHSGGGAALLKILEHTDPHQVHVFDGLYQDASALARWARKRIERDRHALQASGTHSADDYMRAQGGALRVFYQGGIRGGTRPHSLRLRDELAADLGGGLERWYRVEGSSYDHFAIPRNYGWRLLIDASANLPKAQSEPGPTRAREGEDSENWDTEDDYEFDATENGPAQAEEFEDDYELDSGSAVDTLDGEHWADEWEIETAAGESEAGMPEAPLGTLALRTPARTWSYRFTPEDLVWTAKLLVHEAGGEDNLDNAAVLWAMFNRYALFTYDDYPSFSSFIRAYSTTLQPVLRNPQAAARHMHRPPSEFVRTGGTYPGTDIPRGQLRRHLDIQKAPWSAVKQTARQLATRALTGQLPNPGIGLSTQFASTRVYFRQKHGRNPNIEEWRRYTANFAKTKGWTWIGDVTELNQLKNAFFVQRPAAGLPVDAVRVLPPAGVGPWELEHEDAFEAEEAFDGEAELETLASAVTRALRAEWPAIRQGLRRHRRSAGLTPDVAMEPEC